MGAYYRTPRHTQRDVSASSPGGIDITRLLSKAHLLCELLLDEIQRPESGRGLLRIDLDDVTLKIATLGDHQRIGLDVAADTAGRRNLHIASGGHVAVVVSQDDGVYRLHGSVDDPLLADDQLAAHPQLSTHLALDLDRIGDLEFPFHLGGLANDREQGDWRGGGSYGPRGLLSILLASEHRSLLQRASAAALCREIRPPEATILNGPRSQK